MKELIERLERATEGSRELDLEIGELLGLANHSGPAWHRPYKDWARWYTTSIDAALTLVNGALIMRLSVNMIPGPALVHIETANGMIVDTLGSAVAPTPALALCIAALRARSKAEE